MSATAAAAALSRQVRDVVAALRRARAFELQRVVRRLREARKKLEAPEEEGKPEEEQEAKPEADAVEDGEGEHGDSEKAKKTKKKKKKEAPTPEVLETRLQLVKGVNLYTTTMEMLDKVSIELPGKLQREWKEKLEEKEVLPDAPAEKEFRKGVVLRMMAHKLTAAAMRKLEERADAVEDRERRAQRINKKRKREEAMSKPEVKKVKNLPCLVGTCGAKFSSALGRTEHWRKRHTQVFEDRIISRGIDPNDPHAHLELAEVELKRNRPGQRERQRRAEREEKIAARLARERGETEAAPPATKKPRFERPRGTRPTAAPAAEAEPASNLHPSWEAKRKAKEQASKMNAAAFEGKRVVFDSDSE